MKNDLNFKQCKYFESHLYEDRSSKTNLIEKWIQWYFEIKLILILIFDVNKYIF